MLSNAFLLRARAARDLTLTQVAYLWTPRKDRKTSPRGLQAEAEYEYIGVAQCRLDAMDDQLQDDGRDRRQYGLTLPNDAPKLIVGDVVRIDGVQYRLDKASDALIEAIVRRYVVSVSQDELLLAREDC